MSLLSQASLVVTPNGYKEGKLYSVIPSDGSGDLSVTRATTATRVNSQGLVELVPYNLLSYSEQFDQSYWNKYQATITANVTTDPNGTMTADSITNNLNAVASVYVTVSNVNASTTHTLSVYFKKGTYNSMFLEAGGNSYNFALFDINSGTVGTISGFSNVTITNVGNGWFRCVASFSDTASNVFIGYGTAGAPTAGDVTYIWGAQLVEGSVAKDYQKTETRLNIPRLDYSNGTCPSILVEPQRTNSCLYSNKISDSTWLKFFDNGGSAPIITDNYAISPDGSQNAQRIQLTRTTATNSYSYILQNITGVAGQSYTWSVWLKSLSGTPSVALSNIGGSYANIVTISNEWERYEFTTAATGTGLQAMFLLFEQLTTTSLTADFLVYGFQVEAGSYATSYIPTTSASVTRNADVISKTGISSLIGQTEGTIFLDFYYDGSVNNHMIIRDNGYSSYIYFNSANANELWGQIQNVGIQFSMSATAGRYKMALAYKSGSSALYVNGAQIGTSATTFTLSGSINILDYTLSTPNNKINASALWKTRLTNAQLATLTTI